MKYFGATPAFVNRATSLSALRASIGAMALLALAACADKPHERVEKVYDQERVIRVFKDCMKSLPAAPQKTHYSDWDEVVDECRSFAYGVSDYCIGTDKDCQAMGFERSGKPALATEARSDKTERLGPKGKSAVRKDLP